MGLLARLVELVRSPEELPHEQLEDGWRDTDEWRRWEPPRNLIRGEATYQLAIRRLAGPPQEGGWLVPVDVTLERDPENEHDKNAVRASVGVEHVGYIEKEAAAAASPRLKASSFDRVTVAGVVRGGYPTKPQLAVHIWPNRVLEGCSVLRLNGTLHEVPNWPPAADEGDPSSGRRAPRE